MQRERSRRDGERIQNPKTSQNVNIVKSVTGGEREETRLWLIGYAASILVSEMIFLSDEKFPCSCQALQRSISRGCLLIKAGPVCDRVGFVGPTQGLLL